MPLSFVEVRFLALLIITLHFIVIIYAVNYVRMRGAHRSNVYGMVFLMLFLADVLIGTGALQLQLSEDVSMFIQKSQTGIGFAFIFGLGALILLISSVYQKESKELPWYSVLANHVTVFFIGMTFVVDLLVITEPTNIPLLDLVKIGIAIAIGVIIDLIRKKRSEHD